MSSKKGKIEKKAEEKKHIHVILGSNRIGKFNVLKNVFEQNSDVDVLRICIDKAHESLGINDIRLKQILSDQITLILKNDYFRGKYFVESENDIINDAVNLWLQSKKQELNLHNIPFRNHLSDNEKRVALIFVEHQLKFDKGMTIEDIHGHIQDFEEIHIRRVLSKFVKNKLLLEDTIDDKTYYYAPIP